MSCKIKEPYSTLLQLLPILIQSVFHLSQRSIFSQDYFKAKAFKRYCHVAGVINRILERSFFVHTITDDQRYTTLGLCRGHKHWHEAGNEQQHGNSSHGAVSFVG